MNNIISLDMKLATDTEATALIAKLLSPEIAISWLTQKHSLANTAYVKNLLDDTIMWSKTKEGDDFWSNADSKYREALSALVEANNKQQKNVVEEKAKANKVTSVLSYEEEYKAKVLADAKRAKDFKEIHEKALKMAEKAKKKLAIALEELERLDAELAD